MDRNFLSWKERFDPSINYQPGKPSNISYGNDGLSEYYLRKKRTTFGRKSNILRGYNATPDLFKSLMDRNSKFVDSRSARIRNRSRASSAPLSAKCTHSRIFGRRKRQSHVGTMFDNRKAVMKKHLYKKNKPGKTHRYLLNQTRFSPTQRYKRPVTTTMKQHFEIEHFWENRKPVKKEEKTKTTRFRRIGFEKIDRSMYQ